MASSQKPEIVYVHSSEGKHEKIHRWSAPCVMFSDDFQSTICLFKLKLTRRSQDVAPGCWSLECSWSLTWAPFSWRITMVAPQWLSAAWRGQGQMAKSWSIKQISGKLIPTNCTSWIRMNAAGVSSLIHRESFFPMTVLFNQPWICWTYSENEIADGSNSHDHGSEAKLRKPPVKLMVLGLIFSALMLLSIVTAVFYGIGKWLGAFWSTLESPTIFWDKDTVGQIVPQKFWNTKWLQCNVLTQSHSNQFWSPQHFLALCHLHVITSMPRHFVQKYRKPFRQGFRGLNMIPCNHFFTSFPTQYNPVLYIYRYTDIYSNQE